MQTPKEKAENLKDQLRELAKTASKPDEECGRDSENATLPQHSSPLNWGKSWGKGWGKYGKT